MVALQTISDPSADGVVRIPGSHSCITRADWALTVRHAAALQLARVRVLLEAAAAMADALTLVAGDFNSAPASGVHRFSSR